MKEFKAESKKLLDLVVNSIYTNREIFLRELISNASDAIDKRKFMSLTDSQLGAEFAIEIKLDKAARTITVSDNGVGMTEEELDRNLGVIAASGTETFKLEHENATDKSELIGRFGVGFYSAFMVAEKVDVISKSISGEAHKWESDGVSGYEISPCEKANIGTDVVLYLRADGEENYSSFLEEYRIRSLVKKYSDYIRYPIRMEIPKSAEGEIEASEIETLNSMTPVWKKTAEELGATELDDFYKSSYHDYREPLMHIKSRVEGAVEYAALLFIPSEPSFDYYTKDYKRGLSLYCNGVLIMEKCAELIPEYLGFVRGIVDTPDLNLNISRETLQQDRRLRAIANGLEKKILSELKKLLKSDREKYEKLFVAFSKAVKFGAYDNFGENKDKLKDLLLYYSDAEKKLVTFEEFTQKLDKDAPILYACGETSEKISMLPQLEGARESGKDVLYFTDPVDEFVARMLEAYDGHKFENIALASSDKSKPAGGDNAKLLERMASKLKGKAAVVHTDKLKSYPVCLGAKGDVSLEMERVMDALGGGVKADRVLQVNLDHPVITALAKMDGEKFDDTVTVLYNEALIAEGYRTEPDFLLAVNRLLALVPTEQTQAAQEKSEKNEPAKKPASKTATAKTSAAKTSAAKSATKKSTAAKKTTAESDEKNSEKGEENK